MIATSLPVMSWITAPGVVSVIGQLLTCRSGYSHKSEIMKNNNNLFGKTAIIIVLLLISFLNGMTQTANYDTKFKAEYVLKDIHGNEIGRIKVYRNNDKIRFNKVENPGKENELNTDVYAFKNENKSYMITSGKGVKLGYKYSAEMIFLGSLTGVYMFDLGNDGTVFNSSTRAGTETVLGKECVRYNLLTSADGTSDYYMYQDNLLFKRVAATSTDGGIFEVISYDNSSEIPESLFIVPVDVQYLNN